LGKAESAPPPDGGYRIFTTQYDLEIRVEDLPKVMGWLDEAAFRDYALECDRTVDAWRAAADLAAIAAVDRVKAANSTGNLRDTVACLLIDHSGSMRGQRAILGTAVADIVADFWSRIGIAYEILGFTTQSWRGGRSRHAWRRIGQPPNPGRLCDLLHIIYRSADETVPGAPWSIRNLMRRELLKENIDGEAILWAVRRLRARPEQRRVLVVMSDGVPVDDSTLAANDPWILVNHLCEVTRAVARAPDFRLGAVGLDCDVSDFYKRNVVVSSTNDFAHRLVPFLERLFETSANHAPDDSS
jgi:cobaltochelatase CobT